MAEDFKAVNKALQKTNDILQAVVENQKHDNAPRERILDALPEIIDQEIIAKRERKQRSKLQGEDIEAEAKAAVSLQQIADMEPPKEKPTQDVAIVDWNPPALEQLSNIMTMPLKTGKDADFAGGAAETERKNEETVTDEKQLTLLGKISGVLGKMFKSTSKNIASGLKGLKKFLFPAFALAALTFLNNPIFQQMISILYDTLIPLVAWFYHDVLVPIGKKLKKLFKDINSALDGEKGLTDVLLENKLAIAGIVTLLALKTFGISGLITGLKSISTLLNAKKVTEFMSLSNIGLGMFLGGIVMAITDGVEGWHKSKEWGVNKVSGFLGTAFGGTGPGGFDLKGMGKNAAKWALIGAGLGTFFPVIGTFIGGAIGAVIGAVLGYFGGENIAKGIDNMITKLGKAWESLTSLFSDRISAMFDGAKKLLGIEVEETPETLARDEREEKRAKDKKLSINSMNQRNLKNRIDLVQKDVDNDRSDAFFLPESKEEQQKDLSKLKTLEKELAALKKEEKKLASTNIVSADTVNNNQSSSSTLVTSTPIANNNIVLQKMMHAY